ncbi:unnamed protein product, partial [Ectocarpus sp. 12 AP-2014]
MAHSSHDYDNGGSEDASVQLIPRQEVKRFIRNVETPGTFAFGSSLLAPSPKLTVQGLGNTSLPLTNEDVGALRGAAERAPFGRGAETKVGESVRRAWQIDGSLLGLSKEYAQTVGKKYALHAAEKLGLRAKALGVEARLYKLVMYESGGHFRPHKDTEKEAGMFGTLVVQLPTAAGHKDLGVERRQLWRERQQDRLPQRTGSAGAWPALRPDSLRACGDLDLYLVTIVKHESGTAAPRHPQYGCRGRGSSKKCPYDSDYTSADDDSDDGDMFGPDYDDDDFESEDQEMDYKNDVETDVAAKNWVACIDKRMYLDLGIDIESELLCCDDDDDAEYNEEEAVELLFPGNEPDKREYEGYTGNYSPSLEFWYHRAVLVLWPASATMRTALRCGTHAALSAARQRSARYGATDTLPLADLATIVSLAEKKPEEYEFAKKDRYAAAVLDLCTGAGAAALDSSRRFLQLLAGGTPGAVENLDFRG